MSAIIKAFALAASMTLLAMAAVFPEGGLILGGF